MKFAICWEVIRMIEIKQYCDWCGIEVDNLSVYRCKILSCHKHAITRNTDLDLCDKCYEKLREFIGRD